MAPLLLLALLSPLAAPLPDFHVQVDAADPAGAATRLEGAGYDVLGFSVPAGTVDLAVTGAEMAALAAAGYSVTIVAPSAPLSQILGAPDGSPPGGYPDLAAVEASLFATAAAFPAITKLVNAAAVYGPGATYEGRPIHVLKISDNAAVDEDEPNALFVSNHHAREIVTPVIALDLIARLTTGYGTDPAITAWVDGNEIWVAPTWNPDGYAYVWAVDNLWRKNRHPYFGTFGVDQNRNYPLGWASACGGSTVPSSQTYKGPSPASEEETQSMIAFALDRHFAKVIDYHSFGQVVLLTYLCSPFPAALDAWWGPQGAALATACGYAGQASDPSAEGEHYEWEIADLGAFAFLIETHTSFQPAYASAVAEANLVWPGSQWMLGFPIPVAGHVTDACTGEPLVADVAVSGISWSNGELRRSEPRFGRYHLFLPPGTWTVTFTKAGYAPLAVPVTVLANASTTLDAALAPLVTAAAPATVPIGTTFAVSFSAPADATLPYVAAVTASGTSPGIPVNACTLPLNPDFLLTYSAQNLPPFSGFNGLLGASGGATGMVAVPNLPAIAGLGLDFGFVTIDPTSFAVRHPSNAAHVTIVP
jgi:carboxypeptidase T